MHQILSALETPAAHANRPSSSDGLAGIGGSDGFWELYNNPEQEQTIFGGRARSATDANVLRRKGEGAGVTGHSRGALWGMVFSHGRWQVL